MDARGVTRIFQEGGVTRCHPGYIPDRRPHCVVLKASNIFRMSSERGEMDKPTK